MRIREENVLRNFVNRKVVQIMERINVTYQLGR